MFCSFDAMLKSENSINGRQVKNSEFASSYSKVRQCRCKYDELTTIVELKCTKTADAPTQEISRAFPVGQPVGLCEAKRDRTRHDIVCGPL